MESNTNRFGDSEDMPIDDCDLNRLMADCEKWSHKNDLQLLSHLKQMSNSLINKTENTNQSIDSLVFETKMHCVKVDNVINEFQMLANSQFVENRVYDEEMEDIITSGPNLPNEELVNNKNKEEEVLNKIKVALNIGLDFLNKRFDCVSNKVSQNDSDDENDQILEGLISNTATDEYSQRLLPYIIGSEDFMKDNNVGLSYVEESPAIDLKTKITTDLSVGSVGSVDSLESESETFKVKNITNSNNFIDDLNDSEEDSNDLFGNIPKTESEPNDLFSVIPQQSQQNNHKNESISEESESDSINSEDKEPIVLKPETTESNDMKPSMPSFHDELSAVISAKNPNISSRVDKNDTKPELTNKTNRPKSIPSFESESSDENDSIFNITKTKPKSEEKQKNNFSNLFGEEPNDESLFSPIPQMTSEKQINKVLPNPKTQRSVEKTSNLFDDDDDDEDLFGAISKTIKPKPVPKERSEEKVVSNNVTQSVSHQKKPIVSKSSLFSDDEEDNDLFDVIASKSKPKPKVEISDAFESIVKPTISSVKPSKPTDNLIGELSSALKKKKLFISDEESDDSSEDDFKANDLKSNNENHSQISEEKNSFNILKVEEKSESLFSDNNIISEKISSESKTDYSPISKNSNETNPSNSSDFYSDEPTLTLANDGLKHRAALGAQRNRRPPTKKLLKLTPIADFDQNSDQKEVTIANVEDSPPVAAIRTVKTTPNPLSGEIDETQNEIKSEESVEKSFKSLSALIKSPSTEEDDIFPTQPNTSKNQNISKLFEKSENPSIPLFEDSGDNEESLFSSNKTTKNIITKKTIDSRGLFDTSDSDDDNFFSNKSSNVISNIIKPSNSESFNDVSSTDSSLSNKSDLKIGNSKPTVSLFSDSEDEDLFSAVTKTRTIDKREEKQTINRTQPRSEKLEKTPEKTKKSLFSDTEDENTDLFEKKEIKAKSKTNVKPIFDLDDDDDDEDIFAAKTSTTKTTDTKKNKPQKERESSDLFDDPLFVSRS